MEFSMLYVWGGAILLSLLTEAATVHLVAIWFLPAALAALVMQLLGVSPVWQIVTFAVLSLLLILFARPILSKLLYRKPYVPTNADRLIGGTGKVTVTIDNLAEQGEVKIMGETWSARSLTGSVIPQDGYVIVRSIEGVKLICEEADRQT